MCMDKVKDWLFGEEEGYTEDYNTAQNGQEQKYYSNHALILILRKLVVI